MCSRCVLSSKPGKFEIHANNLDEEGRRGFTTRVGLALSISLARNQARSEHYHCSPLTPKFNQTLTSGDLIYRRLPLVFPIHRKPPESLAASSFVPRACLPLPSPTLVRSASVGNVITTTRGVASLFIGALFAPMEADFGEGGREARILTPGHD